MSAWWGKDGNCCSDEMPCVTKIERKPKGVGPELKDGACAQTKIIITLEIQERREDMASKEYVHGYKGRNSCGSLSY